MIETITSLQNWTGSNPPQYAPRMLPGLPRKPVRKRQRERGPREAARKIVAAQMAKKNELAQKLAKEPRPQFA